MKRLTKHLVVRYVIAGGTSAFINLAVLSYLYYIVGIHYLIAGIISFVISFMISLVLQKLWTFKDSSRDGIGLQIGKYLATSLFGLGLNTLLLYILVDHFHFFVYIGQIIAGGSTACVTFFLSRKYVFRSQMTMLDF